VANDGSRTGAYSHTDGGICGTGIDPLPWWMVDLGSQRMIGGGTIWNRDDCCPERLNGFQIWAGNSSTAYNTLENVNCYTAVTTEHVVSPFTHAFTCPVLGQYLYVVIPSGECLSMREVEIYSSGENPFFDNPYLMTAAVVVVGKQFDSFAHSHLTPSPRNKNQPIMCHSHRCLFTMSSWIILCTVWYVPIYVRLVSEMGL
jgi:hypothetical protein